MKQVEITFPDPHAQPPADSVVVDASPAAAPITREQRRSRRKRDVRAKTISVKRMTKRELELGRALYPMEETQELAAERPRTRADCKNAIRPCPWVSCEHHLYLDVSARTGAIKVNFPDIEPHELTESCALDVSDRGGTTLEDVGGIMNLTRERIRQIEVRGLAKMQAELETRGLRDLVDHGGGKRRLPLLEQREEEPDEHEPDTYEGTQDEPGFDVEHFASDALDAE